MDRGLKTFDSSLSFDLTVLVESTGMSRLGLGVYFGSKHRHVSVRFGSVLW